MQEASRLVTDFGSTGLTVLSVIHCEGQKRTYPFGLYLSRKRMLMTADRWHIYNFHQGDDAPPKPPR